MKWNQHIYKCVWSSFAWEKKTLCYEYEWRDVRLHVSMRAGVCVNGTECEPPAVLIQTHTHNTDGVMTFCTSDSCGVFSSLKLIWENENVWPRVATERNTKCKRGFGSFGSIHHKHFINLYIFLSLSSTRHYAVVDTCTMPVCLNILYKQLPGKRKRKKNYNDVGKVHESWLTGLCTVQ